jgi:hypothetical protein
MKKLFTISIIAIALGFTACDNDKKTEAEIDSLNKAAADSLLNAALADTTVTDSVMVVDSLKK